MFSNPIGAVVGVLICVAWYLLLTRTGLFRDYFRKYKVNKVCNWSKEKSAPWESSRRE